MAPQGPAYNIDWIFSNTSNVHVANNREWFTTYVAFPSKLGNSGVFTSELGTSSDVLGIGDVELEVRKVVGDAAKKKRKTKNSVITLRNVLYVPTFICNVFGSPISKDYGVTTQGATSGEITDLQTKAVIGLLDCPVLFKLWLKGQGKGQTSLEPDGLYYINANWDAEERKKWEAFKANGTASKTQGKKIAAQEVLFNDAEKKWLKENYGGEFHFLKTHGLSILEDAERKEGRNIARAMMKRSGGYNSSEGNESNGDDQSDEDHQSNEDKESKDFFGHLVAKTRGLSHRTEGIESNEDKQINEDNQIAEDNDSNDFLTDLETDPASHLADRFFSEEQLDWIQKKYRHSGNFFRHFALKPWDDEDCEEGVSIVKCLM